MPKMTLPHTNLTVPLPCPIAVDLKTLDLACGQAFQAEVWWGGEHVGWFENTGNGGKTAFRPIEPPDAPARAGTIRMADFVAACTHPWLPVSSSMVFTLLVEEHDHAGLFRDALAHGGTAARFLVGGHPIGVFAEVDTPPRHWAEVASYVDLLRDMEPGDEITGRWQVWDGERWRDLAMAA